MWLFIRFLVIYLTIKLLCVKAAEQPPESPPIMVHSSTSTTPLFGQVEYIPHEITAPEHIDFLKQAFENLNRIPSGERLLNLIFEKLGGKKIIIKPTTEGHCFSPSSPAVATDSTHLEIKINFQTLQIRNFQTVVGSFNTQPVTIPEHDSIGRFYEIGTIEYPFFITLGHELIHALHFLENPDAYRARLESEYDKSTWKIYHNETDERWATLWHNVEEQITVIGTPTGHVTQEISELSLLTESSLPPRYAYQPIDRHFFYERAEIIEQIFVNRMPNLTAEQAIQTLQTIQRPNWFFNRESALASPLNPCALKQANATLYRKELSIPLETIEKKPPTKEAQSKSDNFRKRMEQRMVQRRKYGK